MRSFTFASLSLIGIPPTGGFVSKWMLVQGALDASLGWLSYAGLAVLMVSALLTAGYLLPVITHGFFPGKDFNKGNMLKQKDTYMMWITTVALAVSALVFGMFPDLFETPVAAIIDPLF